MATHKLMTLQEEAEAVAKEGGLYVPPFRMAKIVAVASKTFDLLATKGTFQPSYEEILLTLSLVKNMAERACGTERE